MAKIIAETTKLKVIAETVGNQGYIAHAINIKIDGNTAQIGCINKKAAIKLFNLLSNESDYLI